MERPCTVLERIESGLKKVDRIDRRQFLRIGVLGSGVSLVSLIAGSVGATVRKKRRNVVIVFRLSTHGQRTCGACKALGANTFFRTKKAADHGRAHRGCNCKIVKHPIRNALAKKYFRKGDVFDQRSPPKPTTRPHTTRRR